MDILFLTTMKLSKRYKSKDPESLKKLSKCIVKMLKLSIQVKPE